MGRTVNMFGIMVILVAALIQSSSAQTTHVVGDALGWTFPPTTDTYSTWASTKTFTVGDTLVFNFTAGVHDVAEVTNTNFDSCSANAPILLSTTTPTSINLNTTGTRYYICTFGTHCSAGQKVAISVSAAATPPAPQPSPATPPPTPTPTTTPSPPPTPSLTPTPSPSPVSTPSPSPSNSPTSTPSPASAPAPTATSATYVVGDDIGWTVPTGGAEDYQNWAADKTFRVGDILEFIFTTTHTVGEVSTRTAFNSCEITAANNVLSTSPARITLNATGEHFFICTIPTHCTLGQKLAINVTTGTATPPSGTATPPPSGTVAPPPPNGSGPSLASAAMPITLLSIAMALFY